MRRRILTTAILLCIGLVVVAVFYSDHRIDRPTTASLSDEELRQIREAVELEKQSQFKDALSRIERIRSSNPIVALQLIQFKQRLAAQIFDRAQNEYRRGNVSKALQIAKAIPADAPAWQHFRKLQDDWKRNQVVIELAKLYQSQGSYVLATDLLDQIRDPVVRASPPVQAIRAQAQTSQAQIEAKRSMTAYIEPSDGSPEFNQGNRRHQTIDPSASMESYTAHYYAGENAPATALASRSSRATIEADHSVKKSFKSTLKPEPRSTCNFPTCDFSGFE